MLDAKSTVETSSRHGTVFRLATTFPSSGDHPPRHVHVYRDAQLIVKWNLDEQAAMKGAITERILHLILELENEGAL